MGRIESGDMGKGHRQLHTRGGPTTTASYHHPVIGARLISPQSGALSQRRGPQLAELAAMSTWARN
jgi:hypothetical protein